MSPLGMALQRAAPEGEAGMLLCSLPVPRGQGNDLSLGGRLTFASALGGWPGGGGPRRLLLAADGGPAPDAVEVTAGDAAPSGPVPEAAMECFGQSDDPALRWDNHALTARWGGHSVALAMGLRTGGQVHWWENCALVVRERTPGGMALEMGGAIALERDTRAHRAGESFFANPLLHRHNWLNGRLFARLHANGVVELYAHHVNSRLFDDGCDLEDAVPVLGIRVEGAEAEMAARCGTWDGSVAAFGLGPARFDVSEAPRLATVDKPGRMDLENESLAWQPYLGMELYAGEPSRWCTGSPYVCRAEDQRIPRGLARALRLSFSLNRERAPRIARYLAPGWWCGLCEELQPRPVLPARNEYDATLEACDQRAAEFATDRGFEEGSLPRGASRGRERLPEPGWEGEIPYALLLYSWRTGRGETHARALRSCYRYTDVAVDHAARMVCMHAYPPPAFSVPMNRVHACVGAWLETGGPYLIEAAQAVIDTSYWTHKNSWPRQAVGRDASFGRGAAYLYRYLGDEHYLALAADVARDAAHSQRPDGSFGQQAGGTGIHGEGGYITKPWMGLIAATAILDVLDLGVKDDRLSSAVRRFAEWLMGERYEHENGVWGWDYMHYYDGQPRDFSFRTGEWRPLKAGQGLWTVDYLARFLVHCALEYGDATYFDAWAEVYATDPERRRSDHAAAQSLQYVTWVQDELCNARWEDGRVVVSPRLMGPRTPRWDAGGACTGAAPAGVEVVVRPRVLPMLRDS
ncbi:MAG: hypothetical protein ABIL09_19900 [Gemmatimonadota bacterium]